VNCIKCGAPLPLKTDVCEYCHTLNDTDLRKLYDADVTEIKLSDRICPRCNINLQTIGIIMGKTIYIERCKNCLGIFFDPLELEDIIAESIREERTVNRKKFFIFVEEGTGDRWPIKYIKCPVCREFMGRKTYGELSGVIIDWCKDHGVWLDGGELGKILKWKRAGGDQKNLSFHSAGQSQNFHGASPVSITHEKRYDKVFIHEAHDDDKDLLSNVINFIIKLF
jgi:Zn-finger nucleic acid-binding protein